MYRNETGKLETIGVYGLGVGREDKCRGYDVEVGDPGVNKGRRVVEPGKEGPKAVLRDPAVENVRTTVDLEVKKQRIAAELSTQILGSLRATPVEDLNRMPPFHLSYFPPIQLTAFPFGNFAGRSGEPGMSLGIDPVDLPKHLQNEDQYNVSIRRQQFVVDVLKLVDDEVSKFLSENPSWSTRDVARNSVYKSTFLRCRYEFSQKDNTLYVRLEMNPLFAQQVSDNPVKNHCGKVIGLHVQF